MDAPVPLPLDEAVAAQLSRALKLEGFFPEFTPEQAGKLFPRSGLYRYPSGEELMRQGDPGHDLFVLCSGRVAVFKAPSPSPVATLESGALIGEIALVRAMPRTATVTALEDCRVFRLSFLDLQYIFQNNPELSSHLGALAAARLK